MKIKPRKVENGLNDAIERLESLISARILDEIVDTASEACWRYGRYTGPGATDLVYQDGYMLAVLKWYKGLLKQTSEGADEWDNPPKCEHLED